MVLLRFVRWMLGYVRITVRGHFTERFLNLVNCRGIRLWNVERISSGVLGACIRAKKFKKLRQIRSKTGVRIEIVEKCGLPFLKRRYRRRVGLALGFVLFGLLLGVMSCFIWSVEIAGDVTVPDEVILEVLDRYGLRPGVLAAKVDVKGIRHKVLIELDELSFCAINLFGSKAVVEVAQATPSPQIEDTSTPCDLVAKADGVIVEARVTQGVAKVRAGDAVLAGDILVSGTIESDKVGYRTVHSAGVIYARTNRTLECRIDYEQTQVERTGESYNNYRLRLFNFYINLYFGAGARYDKYDKIEKRFELRIGNFVFPVELVRQTYYETAQTQLVITAGQAENAALLQLQSLQAERLFGKVVEGSRISAVHTDGACIVTGEFDCLEDIAEKRIIESQ